MNTGMKLIALSMVSLVTSVASVGESYADTVLAANCSYAEVSSKVSAAAADDTVVVPAGSCIWSSTLNLIKGITLQGAGIGNSIITKASTGNLIEVGAADPSTNPLIRITGFTFDGGGSGTGLLILLSGGNQTTTIQTKLRVDHNRFQNSGTQYVWWTGIRGVIDNNVFGSFWYPLRTPTSFINRKGVHGHEFSGRAEWNDWQGIVFGAPDNNMYFEDNVFEGMSNPEGVIVTDCQEGERYAFRYNTINIDRAVGGWPLFDMHGNYTTTYGCFGGEIYGNNVVGAYGGYLIDQRGGRVFMFNNNVTAPNWRFHIREEEDDSTSPVTYAGPNPPQYPLHVNGSYYWGNRRNMTGASPGVTTDCGSPVCTHTGDIPLSGRDFFTDTSSPGITAGTLANRPATCSTGQGYWATNQSTTNLTGMVGAHPATPISGTLYRCVTPNTWDSGRSPLPYPHPLRAESSTSLPPSKPQQLQVF